jgi:hypothetical protein
LCHNMAWLDKSMTQLVDSMPHFMTTLKPRRRWLWGKAPCLNEGIWIG